MGQFVFQKGYWGPSLDSGPRGQAWCVWGHLYRDPSQGHHEPAPKVSSGPWLSRRETKLRFGAEGPVPGWLPSVSLFRKPRSCGMFGKVEEKRLQTEFMWGRQAEASRKDALQDAQGSGQLSAPQTVSMEYGSRRSMEWCTLPSHPT